MEESPLDRAKSPKQPLREPRNQTPKPYTRNKPLNLEPSEAQTPNDIQAKDGKVHYYPGRVQQVTFGVSVQGSG